MITFKYVSNTVRQLGVHWGLCTVTNPTSGAPPFWDELDDTDVGRTELARRIRALFAIGNSGLHGDERAFLIKAWAQKELPNA